MIHSHLGQRYVSRGKSQQRTSHCLYMGGRVPVGKLGCCGEVNARKCGLHGLCATTKQDFDNIRTVQNGISLKRCDTCPDRIELPDGEIPVPTGKLRVGMLSPNWYVGGVERWFQTLARYSELEIVGVAVDSGNRVSPAMLGNGFRVTRSARTCKQF